jgi:integrase
MRRGEMVVFEWKDGLERQTILLHTTKNGSARTVPLSTEAMALLKTLPTRDEGNVFGFRPDANSRFFTIFATREKGI